MSSFPSLRTFGSYLGTHLKVQRLPDWVLIARAVDRADAPSGSGKQFDWADQT